MRTRLCEKLGSFRRWSGMHGLKLPAICNSLPFCLLPVIQPFKVHCRFVFSFDFIQLLQSQINVATIAHYIIYTCMSNLTTQMRDDCITIDFQQSGRNIAPVIETHFVINKFYAFGRHFLSLDVRIVSSWYNTKTFVSRFVN